MEGTSRRETGSSVQVPGALERPARHVLASTTEQHEQFFDAYSTESSSSHRGSMMGTSSRLPAVHQLSRRPCMLRRSIGLGGRHFQFYFISSVRIIMYEDLFIATPPACTVDACISFLFGHTTACVQCGCS